MDKKKLTETDIRTKYITPAIIAADWDIHTQVFEEYGVADGRIMVRGRLHSRQASRRADYVLCYQKNQSIAVVEAKDNKHRLGDGMQQAFRFDNSSAQRNLSANSTGLYSYPVPPLAEQKHIVAKVDELFALCDQLKTRLQAASETQLTLTEALVEQALK